MDNEIRRVCPLVFYHLWDDEPFPKFNIPYYNSCDHIIAGSKFTWNLLTNNDTPENMLSYAPIGFDLIQKCIIQFLAMNLMNFVSNSIN